MEKKQPDDPNAPGARFWDDDEEPREECHYCGGEGWGYVDDFGEDPLWHGFDAIVPCPCCRGSGRAEDERFW